MPTGYTHKIGEGQSFDDFIWGCARAMGALISMRDEPADAPIPKEIGSSDIYKKKAEELGEKITKLQLMTAEEILFTIDLENIERKIEADKSKKRERALFKSYHDMKEKVSEWIPPTDGHVEFKDFMLQQINSSIKWDCGYSHEYTLVEPDAKAWYDKQFELLNEDWKYYIKKMDEEEERNKGKNLWVKQLRDSLTIKE